MLFIIVAAKIVASHYCASLFTTSSVVLVYKTNKRRRYYHSVMMHKTAEKPVLETGTQRVQFDKQPLLLQRKRATHTHGESAVNRNAATLFIESLSSAIGSASYALQKSANETRRNRQGSRLFYWAKDIHSPPEEFKPPKSAMISCVDVSYYLDMPSLLADYFQPWCLYTLQPGAAAIHENEYSMCWKEDNTVEFYVSGGAVYRHKIWNWSHDSIKVQSYLFGLPYMTAVYLVDRRSVDKHHQLVNLTPVARWSGFTLSFLSRWIDGDKLERLEPVKNGFSTMTLQTKEGNYFSVARVGSCDAATVSSKVHTAIVSQARHGSKITMAQIVAINATDVIKKEKLQDSRRKAAILWDYISSLPDRKDIVIFPVSTEDAVRGYDYGVDEYDPDDKESMVAFMSPIINLAFVPRITAGNELQAMKTRIKNVQHTKPFIPNAFTMTLIDEFVDFLVPPAYANSLAPVSFEEISEHQNRPTQQVLLQQAMLRDDKYGLEAFLKKEAYSNPKNPRIITVDQPAHKYEYSQFMYSFMDYCKRFSWYMPGKTPSQVAQRVADIATTSEIITSADESTYDGRVNSFIREPFKRAIQRAFHGSYKTQINDVYEGAINKTVNLRNAKTKYASLWVILSGMISTSCLGTIGSAFVLYTCLRTTRVNGKFMSPTEAWQHLETKSAACGDDMLAGDVKAIHFRKAAKKCGLLATSEETRSGHLGVEFLSRAYGPDVWFGDPTSMTCLHRQVTKFHVTCNLAGVSAKRKLLEKSRSFLLTDKNTPILGELVSKVSEIYGDIAIDERLQPIQKWLSDLPKDMQYPNDYANWMETLARKDLPNFDFEAYRHWLTNVTHLEQIFMIPLFDNSDIFTPKDIVVVDGDIVTKEDSDAQPEEKPRQRSKRGKRGGKSNKRTQQ